MYYLTTENALDLIELDIYEEKAVKEGSTKKQKLVSHMKKYYKYYLISAGLVAGITAAIIIAKKNGDREEVKQLENALKEAKTTHEETKKLLKKVKRSLNKPDESLFPNQLNPFETEADKIERTLKDIKDTIPNKYKSVVNKEIPKEIPKIHIKGDSVDDLNDSLNKKFIRRSDLIMRANYRDLKNDNYQLNHKILNDRYRSGRR